MKITKVVVHCSDTPNGRETSAEDIHRWHRERGWDGIGYHHVIKLNGEIEAGRPRFWQGAHADPFNKDSIGVCLVGRDEFTADQMRALEGLILSYKAEYSDAQVLGHNDLNPHKTCPNFDVKAWWVGVKNRSLD